LEDVEDTTRIVQRFLLGKGDPGDLVSISRTIKIWNSIRRRLELEKKMESSERGYLLSEEWSSVDVLMNRMADLEALGSRINLALQDVETSGELKTEDEESEDNSPPANAEESNKIVCKFDTPSRCTIRPEYAVCLFRTHDCSRLLTQILFTVDIPPHQSH